MGNKSEITGGGAVPPPDAPIESAQPIQPDALDAMLANAAVNEKVLPPFNPKPMGRPIQALSNTVSRVKDATADLIADVFGTDPPKVVSAVGGPRVQEIPKDRSVVAGQGLPIPQNDPMFSEVDQLEDVLPELTAEDLTRMPAASNTDTPSKGLLPNLTPPKGDKFDGIARGGFGNLDEAQYFPLSGDEAGQLALALMDTLAAQIPNDLRFSMALTYPRIRMTLQLIVEGQAEDNNAGFEILKIKAPKEGEKGGTPLEIAQARADQVCFVISARRQEFTPEGESDQPPDAIRDELGLHKPRKQIIETNGRQAFVDVVPGSDLAALRR